MAEETVLLARAEKAIAVSLVDVVEPVKKLYLLDSFATEVGALQQLYLLSSYDADVIPLISEVILLDKYEQYIGTEPTGIYMLASHEAYIEPEGIPVEPEEPPAKVNWWLWGGLGLIAVALAVGIARKGG